jgi:predicted alpha/beta superfamily hydrolase
LIDDGTTLPGTEAHYLRSTAVGDEFKILIGHCGSETVEHPLALYLPDANGTFGMAVDLVRVLQLGELLPPLLVVGIGYRVGGLRAARPQRYRDLTPTNNAADDAERATDPDYGPNSRSGGGEQFLEFIADQLKPWVEQTYGASPDGASYAGYSLGGMFGGHVLFTRPALFANYILGSPSLWWDDEAVFAAEQRYAQKHHDLAASVFLSVGGDEAPVMVDVMRRMATALGERNYPSLRLASTTFADEVHVSACAPAFTRGLRFAFDGWSSAD